MSQVINTRIEISAPAEKVWNVLTDFKRYPDWNPFVRTIKGELCEGSCLQVFLQPPEGKAMVFNPTIISIKPGRQLVWVDRVLFPGLFDGEHRFVIKPLTNGHVIFCHSEAFNGLLSKLILKLVGKSTEAGFHAMNAALKQRVEAGK
ncbi:hypothetical protein MNBD_GAMMA19-931 [hydrothermal vent metagenome]|uniref:Polyketide cyclase/dehydrase n=1 Tax=hydrothermal vent metagenome TaxID=652676 RepID=A0A3B0ZXW6_9ZZZZ